MRTHSAHGSDGRHGFRKCLWKLVFVVSASLFLIACSGGGESSSSAAPGGKGGRGGRGGRGGAVPVSVALATQRDVPVEVQVIGNVEAYATVSVKAQVGGQLTEVHFQEGQFVSKGNLLFTIDPRPFQAALNQAIANNARDRAALGQAQANLARDSANAKYAASQAARYAELFRSGVVSRDQSEQTAANADAVAQAVAADKAAIESAKAAIGASQAAIETARINLGYTTVRAPINGRTGAITVKQGNVVAANSADLTAINQVEPIYVTFAVPEAQLAAIKRYMTQQKLQVRAEPQDSPQDLETGVLTFVDNSVDATTGTIKLKGVFPNKDHKLWPGQFVRVTLRLTTQSNATVVPNEAVQTGQDGAFVYVVKQDQTVESRPITAGARVEQDMVVEKGLQPGETVVTEGQLRLAPGMRVMVQDGRRGGGRPKS